MLLLSYLTVESYICPLSKPLKIEKVMESGLGSPVIVHHYTSRPTWKQNLGRNFVVVFVLAFFISTLIGSVIFFALPSQNDLSTNAPSFADLAGRSQDFTTLQPTFNPSVDSLTSSPTAAPTYFPTKGPITQSPTTGKPTSSPTLFPTEAPVSRCQTIDATCGCNKVISNKIDVIFLVDESGSVGLNNYELMKSAISEFVQSKDPPFDSVNGLRVGYIEFSGFVNDIIEMSEFNETSGFLKKLESFTYDAGGTDHRFAIIRAHEMIQNQSKQGLLRNDSELAVVMLTDGNPCAVCGRYCCSGSYFTANGGIELRAFRDEFRFTFYFLPINPGIGTHTVSLTLFNAALGPRENSTGLSEDEFKIFDAQDFDQLTNFFAGEQFTLPLGPCTPAIPPSFL